MEIKPSTKRFTVTISGQIFTTQKSLIEKGNSIFDVLMLPKNQQFIQSFVLTYNKVLSHNKQIKRVYYGPND